MRWKISCAAVVLLAGWILVVRAQQPTTAPVSNAPDSAPATSDNGYMRVLLRPSHPPVFDSQHRAITAGGFVDGAPVVFEDVTHHSGIDKFHHRSGTPDKSTIIEVPGSGVALLDYDNDGWLDIYLLNGSTIAALKGREPAPRAMLLRNNHDGTFTDVTAKAGVAAGGVRQRADVFSGGSYGSNSDPRVHFGLGKPAKVDKLEIEWPSGTKQEITLPALDRIFTVDETRGLLR